MSYSYYRKKKHLFFKRQHSNDSEVVGDTVQLRIPDVYDNSYEHSNDSPRSDRFVSSNSTLEDGMSNSDCDLHLRSSSSMNSPSPLMYANDQVNASSFQRTELLVSNTIQILSSIGTSVY